MQQEAGVGSTRSKNSTHRHGYTATALGGNQTHTDTIACSGGDTAEVRTRPPVHYATTCAGLTPESAPPSLPPAPPSLPAASGTGSLAAPQPTCPPSSFRIVAVGLRTRGADTTSGCTRTRGAGREPPAASEDGREGCFTAAATTTGTGPPSTAPAPPDTPPSVALASAAGTGTGAAPGSLYLLAPH